MIEENTPTKKSWGRRILDIPAMIGNLLMNALTVVAIVILITGFPVLVMAGMVLIYESKHLATIVEYLLPIYNLAPSVFNTIIYPVIYVVGGWFWLAYNFSIFVSDQIYGPVEHGQTIFAILLMCNIIVYVPVIAYRIIQEWCYKRGYSISWPSWARPYRNIKRACRKILGIKPEEKTDGPKPHQPLFISKEYEPPTQARHPIYEDGQEPPEPEPEGQPASMTTMEKLESWFDEFFTDEVRKFISVLIIPVAVFLYTEEIFIGAFALGFLAGLLWYVSAAIFIVILMAMNAWG